MPFVDFMSSLHKKTQRDYLGRVNAYPKAEAARLAKKWDIEYWDGSRDTGYGGYRYDGRWRTVAEHMARHYDLKAGDRVLDVGCGKGFLLYDFTQVVAGIDVAGVDISRYAIEHAHEGVKDRLQFADAKELPFPDASFDLVVSITTLHNLRCFDMEKALREMQRVGRRHRYLCVESFRSEEEKVNLLYWQLTCACFFSPEEWLWWFEHAAYTGDYSFIYFEQTNAMHNVPETAIIGANGFIGQFLLAAYRRVHPNTIGTTRRHDGSAQGLAHFDLEKPDIRGLGLEKTRVRAAIITAAISRVVPCEEDPQGSQRANVTGTLELIEQLHARGILPIFLSTDYVFDGTRQGGYGDEAPLCPCTEYGRQKAAVEQALARSGKPFLVLRLSKNYGLVRGDNSLLDEMAGRLFAGREYPAAHDQVFCPTCVHDLAPALMEVQGRGLTGVFNFCASEPWSRFDLAMAVAEALGVPTRLVRKISLGDLPGKLCRPRCTQLLVERLARETDVRFASLAEMLPRLAQAYREARPVPPHPNPPPRGGRE